MKNGAANNSCPKFKSINIYREQSFRFSFFSSFHVMPRLKLANRGRFGMIETSSSINKSDHRSIRFIICRSIAITEQVVSVLANNNILLNNYSNLLVLDSKIERGNRKEIGSNFDRQDRVNWAKERESKKKLIAICWSGNLNAPPASQQASSYLSLIHI